MGISWSEDERLSALRGYRVLDSDIELDDVVEIAAEICRAPVSVVNFIDQHRQWFGGEVGLGVRETPVDVSICAHALLERDILIVPDLTKDPRFDGNPLVLGDPKLRFYGGALLKTPSGLPLGTVCVLDYAPRPEGLTDKQVGALKALSRRVMAQLEMRRIVAEKDLLVSEAHHRVSNSLQMVQSLLTLQSRKIENEAAAQILQESAERIRTFGQMHQHLYRTGAAVSVDIAAYLKRLVEDQEASLASVFYGRGIRFSSDAILWPSSDAATVGLIVFELVTNALKHGVGTVTVQVTGGDGYMFIAVSDEGADLPLDHDPAASTGLGMGLVRSFVHARGGSLMVDRSQPTTTFVAKLEVPS